MLRALLRFQNPDSTQDLNDQTRDLFNKGIFIGGEVEPVPASLSVTVSPFATIGSDGMFVREDDETNTLSVQAGIRNYIVIRQRYVENDEPTISVESLTEAEYLGDPELDFLVTFAVVDVPVATTAVTDSMIEKLERDEIDPLGRLSFRGRLTNAGDLPAGSLNINRPGDFYILSDGVGGFPELWAWNGVDWVNITQVQTLSSLLDDHRDNLDVDRIHLTNLQAEAVLGTTGTPSDSNRYVTSLDPRLPSQDENDALQGDLSILSDGIAPSDSNRFVTAAKVFAQPTEKSFVGSTLIELPDAEGPYFVGKGTIGTAQKYFNIFSDESGQEDDDQELLNSEFQSVRITGVFTDASFTLELNPGADVRVDALGFFSGGSLFLETDNPADVDFTIGLGKRTTIGDLIPEAFINRGPQFGQVDSRVVKLLSGDVNAQFSDALWGSVDPGDVVGFDSGSGTFVKHDSTFNTFGVESPLGVRGNSNNLIMEGLYEFPASSGFSAGDNVYASELTDGELSTTPNEWFIGTFVTDTLLLVNMNAFGISPSSLAQGVVFPGGFFDAGLAPGEVAAFDSGSGTFVEADLTTPGLEPVGVRGNDNNIIMEGSFTPTAGTPYVAGTRYFASPSSGALSTTENDWYIARGITSNTILINVNHIPIWEDAKTVFTVDHFNPSGRHREGSARTFIGLAADRFAASGSNSEFTGAVFFATDTGVVYYCTDGATNTWIQQSVFDGSLEITGSLIIPSRFLDDDAGDTMDPFDHSSRHAAGGEDPLTGLTNGIFGEFVGGTSTSSTGVTLATTSLSFAGRSGTSRGFFLWEMELFGGGNNSLNLEVAIRESGGSDVASSSRNIYQRGNDFIPTHRWGAYVVPFSSIPAADTDYELYVKTHVSGTWNDSSNCTLAFVDLGLE